MGCLCWMVFGTAVSVFAQSVQVIGNTGNGSFPGSMAEINGKLFGMTSFGGGDGNIYTLPFDGPVTFPYQFDGTVGSQPESGLVKSRNGHLYGVLAFGPKYHQSAIIDATPPEPPRILYEFTGGDDGSDVEGGLQVSIDGKSLYGTCYRGGTNGNGVVFQYDLLGGKLIVLHRFNGTDGQQPIVPPFEDSDGTLYGTTAYGGSEDKHGGTFYKISSTGFFTSLKSFPAFTGPENVIRASDGEYYTGATNGSLLELTTDGNVTNSYPFSDGFYPIGNMVNIHGLLYGTIRNDFGNGVNQGGVFSFDPVTKTFPLLKQAAGHPEGGLLLGSDGNLYFTVEEGNIYKVILQPPQLVNISTRLDIGTGANVLIGGFIITGSQPKEVMIRAIGPSLSADKVTGALADPTLELHDQSGALIASNDDWGTTEIGGVIQSNQMAEIAASGLKPASPRESAIIASLSPGAYTAVVQGKGGSTGVGLVEVYDRNPSAGSELANISTRGLVQSGDDAMIGGLIVTGGSEKVIVRAIGPSLAKAGIAGALQDPTLELHDGNGNLVASNDNWQTTETGGSITGSQVADIQKSGLAPADPAESAIIATLGVGAYTAIVRGANDTTGIGLVETYQLTK